MKHKCDRCSREASVTEVSVRNGQKIEKHLCEQCAREEGIQVQQQHAPINELITKFVMTHGEAVVTPAGKTPSCGSCGLSFAEFRQRGLLGCSDCYKTFEPQLSPLLERAHEGGTHHCGKTPKRAGLSLDRQQRLTMLRKQLSDAIAAEQYEKAANLRDELANVETSIRSVQPASGEGSPMRELPGERA
jgi:protein arginine kinase activator